MSLFSEYVYVPIQINLLPNKIYLREGKLRMPRIRDVSIQCQSFDIPQPNRTSKRKYKGPPSQGLPRQVHNVRVSGESAL